MRNLFTIIIAVITAISMAACEASGIADTTTGEVAPIADYNRTIGWNEGEVLTTPEGHYWIVENPNNYMGYVEVAYDGRGTATVDDDLIVYILEIG